MIYALLTSKNTAVLVHYDGTPVQGSVEVLCRLIRVSCPKFCALTCPLVPFALGFATIILLNNKIGLWPTNR